MGGIRSTRWNEHSKKHLAEQMLSIDCWWFIRAHLHQSVAKIGYTTWGVLRWGDGAGSASFFFRNDGKPCLTISYQLAGRVFVHHIRFTSDSTPWGAARWWFACPCCARRCRLLYLAGQTVACRTCGNLTYASAQTAHHDEALHLAQRLSELYDQLQGSRRTKALWTKVERLEAKRQRLI